MSSIRQIDANRQNSRKSTGPRTVEGKAASRFNALKTGIDSQAEVIPGENAAHLAELTAWYYRQFRPAGPIERCLVDILVASEWRLHRFHKVEAQLWRLRINGAHVDYTHIHRLIQLAERSYLRALKGLERLHAATRPASDQDRRTQRSSVWNGVLIQ